MSEIPITAREIADALTKQLLSTRNGETPRWAVFTELRLGVGFTRDRRGPAIKAYLDFARRASKENRGEILIPDDLLARYDIQIEGKADRRGILVAPDVAIPVLREAMSGPRTDPRESRIDLFALDCYGIDTKIPERRAYEIKVDKQDLKNELANPHKRAPWLEIVSGFFLVIPKGLATAEQIAEEAPECGVIYYTRLPDRPNTRRRRELCTCPDLRQREASQSWIHLHECPYREEMSAFEKAQRGRRLNTARPAMKLDGAEPSWSMVASILRAAGAR